MPRTIVKIHLTVSGRRIALCGLQNVNSSFTLHASKVTCERCIKKLERQRKGEMGVVR